MTGVITTASSIRGSRPRWRNSLRTMAPMRIRACLMAGAPCVRRREPKGDCPLFVPAVRRGRRTRSPCRARPRGWPHRPPLLRPVLHRVPARALPEPDHSTRTTSPSRWADSTPGTPWTAASAARGWVADTSTSRPGTRALISSGVPELLDAPGVEEGDLGAALGLVHVRRGDQHGLAGPVQPGEDAPELAPRDRVDAGGRLVEQQQVGLVHQGGREHQLLLHAAGEVLGLPLGELGEPHPFEQAG